MACGSGCSAVVVCLLECGASLHTGNAFWSDNGTQQLLSCLPEDVSRSVSTQLTKRNPLCEKKALEELVREYLYFPHINRRAFRAGYAYAATCMQYMCNAHRRSLVNLLLEGIPLEMLQEILLFKLEAMGLRGMLTDRAIWRLFRLSVVLLDAT